MEKAPYYSLMVRAQEVKTYFLSLLMGTISWSLRNLGVSPLIQVSLFVLRLQLHIRERSGLRLADGPTEVNAYAACRRTASES